MAWGQAFIAPTAGWWQSPPPTASFLHVFSCFLGRDGLVWLRATLLAPLSVLGGGVTGACGVLWGQGLSFGCGGQVSGTCGHWSQA